MPKPIYVKKAEVVPASQDKLDAIRDKLREARDLQLRRAQLTFDLEVTNKAILKMEQETLPSMAQDARIDALGLEPEGNLPGYDLEIKAYYHANIKEDAPNAPAAYAYLVKTGNGDMIKHQFTITFGRNEHKEATAFATQLKKLKVEYSEKLGVPWNTLTAWLKEQVEKSKTVPPLDLIDGKIGVIAKVKPRKEVK